MNRRNFFGALGVTLLSPLASPAQSNVVSIFISREECIESVNGYRLLFKLTKEKTLTPIGEVIRQVRAILKMEDGTGSTTQFLARYVVANNYSGVRLTWDGKKAGLNFVS